MGNMREQVKVWDWQLRVIHWGLALSTITLAALAILWEAGEELGMPKEGRETLKEVHAYVGYSLVLFLVLRIIWGFMGNRYARWGDIFPHTKAQWEGIKANLRWYFRGFRGAPPDAVGHDPVASLIYIAFFGILISQVVTGLGLSGLEFNLFPGPSFMAGIGEAAKETLEHGLEEVHEFGHFFILFYLVFHLAGGILHDVKGKTGLFSSMVSGVKYLGKEEKD